MKNTLFVICIFFFSASQNIFAQEIYTEFVNPSMEDLPKPSHPPHGWWDCGFPGETPPDVHPILPAGTFNVTQTAQHGNTYLGMVVRQNDTWESVSQRLNTPLKPDQCYSFSLFMCMSDKYVSNIKGQSGLVDFTEPILLRVWGGTGFCNKKELLAKSELIDHTDWIEYNFQFTPSQEIKYIVLETFFDHNVSIPPNGNLLIDNLSPIYLDCKSFTPTPMYLLRKKLEDEGQNIVFNKENKLTDDSEELISSISEAMLQIEKIHLVFGIRSKKKKVNKEHINYLEAFLKSKGLDEKKFTVRKYDRTDNQYLWQSSNKDLSIGLADY